MRIWLIFDIYAARSLYSFAFCLYSLLLMLLFVVVYLRTFPKTNNRHGYPHSQTNTHKYTRAGKVLWARFLDVNKQFSTFQHSLIKTEIMGMPIHTRAHTHTHMATCMQFTHVFVCATTVASGARSAKCPGQSSQGDLTGQQIVAHFSAHVN